MKLLLAPLTVLAALVMIALALPGSASAEEAPTDHPLTGSWYLELNHGVPVLEDRSITLSFNENGQIEGSGGCNSYGGSYTIDGNTLQFGNIVSTLMACADNMLNQQEADYFAALSQVTGYRRIGLDRLVLDLSDGSALVFIAVPALAGSSWVLIDDGLPDGENLVTTDSGVTLMFDKDGNANGDSGCNLYRTTYTLMVGSLTFDPILSTRRACLNEDANALETHLFRALEATTSYTITPEQLILYYGEDEQQLVFRRVLNLEGTTWQLVAVGAENEPTSLPEDSVIKVSFGADDTVSVSGVCQSDTDDSFSLESLGEISVQELPSLLPACIDGSSIPDMLPITRYEINDDNQLVIRYGDDQALVFEFVE